MALLRLQKKRGLNLLNLLNGKEVSAKVLRRIEQETRELPIQPCLAVLLVGEDSASRIYVNNKKKACEQVGFRSLEYSLPADYGQAKLLDFIARLNADATVHGILCQAPLPKNQGYLAQELCCAISPDKDVDAFHPVNVGKITLGEPAFLPCTPAGIMELLRDADISLAGKHVVVVGRSNIVGKPMALLALQANATVTICHSYTENLSEVTRSADVLIAAVGKLHFITAEMVKNGAIVIDVGMNRLEGKKVRGDVDFDAVAEKCSYITPVPGGVGAMTIAMLMQNTLIATKNTLKIC
jgi:methylenetetrahydrofolate dehydrogenase (NADP+)/methenyltetrahydrofolate cyclohydrolase